MSAAAKVRLGLIGAGRWGHAYIRTLGRHTEARLAAVASSNPTVASHLPEGCFRVADWRALLACRLDGIIIATPPATHVSIASEALAAGLPVLVEKPLCLNPSEAHSFRDLAIQRSGLVIVDHIHLFAPAFRALRAEAARLGRIHAIVGQAGSHGPYRADASVLWDWGPHDAAMIFDLVGSPPTRTHAVRLDRRPTDGGMGETIHVAMEFPGTTAEFTVSTLMDKTRRLSVICDRGTLIYDDFAAHKIVLDRHPIPFQQTPPLDVAIAEFAVAIRTRSRTLTSLNLAVDVIDLLAVCDNILSSSCDTPLGGVDSKDSH